MSTRLLGMISAHLAQGDSLEAALQELRDGLWLYTATGANLDMIGRVYGVTRQGRQDPDYRASVQVRAATVVNGTPDEILTFLQIAYGYTDLEYLPQYPAAFLILGAVDLTNQQLESLAPAGVGAYNGDFLSTVEGVTIATVDGESIAVVKP